MCFSIDAIGIHHVHQILIGRVRTLRKSREIVSDSMQLANLKDTTIKQIHEDYDLTNAD